MRPASLAALLLVTADAALSSAFSVGGTPPLRAAALSLRGQRNSNLRGGSHLAPEMQLGGFGGLFGRKEEQGGKFERQGKLEGIVPGLGFGPLGLIVGGLGEEELEVLAESVEQVLDGTTPPGAPPPSDIPIAVLGAQDLRRGVRLQQVLDELSERDSVLPDQPAELRVPLVLLSGFSPIQVSAVVKAIVGSGIKGGRKGFEVSPMCAIAVPKALDKTMQQLCEEIEGDHMAAAGAPVA